ncbi:MAG: hypothetical protein V7K85_11820 [Nostoc sp.]
MNVKAAAIDRLYSQTVGLSITDTVRQHAKRICDLQREEYVIEEELRELLDDPRFDNYRTVFKKFGFGDHLSSVIISQIYPIEGFLDASGKPEVKIRLGRNSKKPTKRHLSLRRFQKALGGALDGKSFFYPTWDDAIQGHLKICTQVFKLSNC